MKRFKINSLLTEDTFRDLDYFLDVHHNEEMLVIDLNCMGADVKQFMPLMLRGCSHVGTFVKRVHETLRRLETHPATTVAVIDGFALGGGFEVALACDYRIATPNSKVGLPETTLGIIPGFGGTIRLPRIISFEDAATWISTGKQWKAQKAYDMGALDFITNDTDPTWISQFPKVDKEVKLNISELEMAFETVKAQVWPKTGNYPAPRIAIQLMKLTAFQDIDTALEKETKAVMELSQLAPTMEMLKLFFANQEVKNETKDTSSVCSRVGVVGGGLMGGGIAYQVASYGNLPVHVVDISRAQCDLSVHTAIDLGSKRNLNEQVARNVTAGLTYDFSDSDVIIEAVTENLDVKRKVLREIDAVRSNNSIIATNTSSISLAELESSVAVPSQLVGLHFFSPVHRMPLVEVVRGPSTSDATIEKAVAFVKQIGKTPIVVNDCVGFAVNRCLTAYLNPALYYLRDGGKISSIDSVAKKFGWPMGPFELIDSVGKSVALHTAKNCEKAYGKKATKPRGLVIPTYDPAKPFTLPYMQYVLNDDVTASEVEADVANQRKLFSKMTNEAAIEIAERQFNKTPKPDDVFNQMMNAFFTEVDKCVDEGIIKNHEVARMLFILGTGYPPFKAFEKETKNDSLHFAVGSHGSW